MIRLERRSETSRLMAWISPLLAVLLTLISGAMLFWMLDKDPLAGLSTFLLKPYADTYSLAELAVKGVPILLCAIGLSVVFRAQIWNIGAEGQLLFGALGGGFVALQLLNTEAWWVLPVVLASGVLAGAFWAFIAAFLRTRFNTNEILTTIMLNYIALNLILWAVHGPLKDPDGYNFPESAFFAESALLPTLVEGTRVHLGLLFALFGVVLIWVLISRSFLGFQIRVLGLDRRAARFAGFREQPIIWSAMLISGAFSGLAGVSEVTGPIGQLVPQISPGYGYSAIIVVFLGRMHPVGISIATLMIATIYMGGELAQIELGLPSALTGLFQGMLLFYLLASDVLIYYRIRLGRPTLAYQE